MGRFTSWIDANRLKLNETKTVAYISSQDTDTRILKVGKSEITYTANNSSTKYLGVQFNPLLCWKDQGQATISKLRKGNGAIYRAKKYLNTKTLKLIYNALFEAHLTYAMEVWYPSLPKKLHSQIERLQKSAVRNLAKKPRLTHSMPLFKLNGVLRVEDKLSVIYTRTLLKAYDSSTLDITPKRQKELPLPLGLSNHIQLRKTNTRSGTTLATQAPRQQDILLQRTFKDNRDIITDKGLTQKRRIFHVKNNYLDKYVTACTMKNCYICTNKN